MSTSIPPALPVSLNDYPRKRRKISKVIAVTIVGFVVLANLTLVSLRAFGLARPFSVPTSGMSPAIRSGDLIIMEGFTYLTASPKSGDVVAFKTDGIQSVNGNYIFVKRLVGLPGDQLRLNNGILSINGKTVSLRNRCGEIQYVPLPQSKYLANDTDIVTVPDHHYFVLGDNSVNSSDSRFWGAIPAKAVLGRVVFCYWPLKNWGWIK
jgi:signal peptidase I